MYGIANKLSNLAYDLENLQREYNTVCNKIRAVEKRAINEMLEAKPDDNPAILAGVKAELYDLGVEKEIVQDKVEEVKTEMAQILAAAKLSDE